MIATYVIFVIFGNRVGFWFLSAIAAIDALKRQPHALAKYKSHSQHANAAVKINGPMKH